LIDFGDQPVCHRFIEGAEKEERRSLALGQCEACGLIQLTTPMPVEVLSPRYDWIKYNEPEAHLESMAQRIAALPGISTDSRILGVCLNERPLLGIMQARGFRHADMVDPVRDLGLEDGKSGVESVQSRLTRQAAEAIVRERGFSDVVIARRILEHAHDLVEFLRALRALVHPQGYVVVEVPDCQKELELVDVGAIWEEHILYFTAETFQEIFPFSGLNIQQFESYPDPQENCLVVIAQPGETVPAFLKDRVLKQEIERAAAFVNGLVSLREGLRRHLSNYHSRCGKVAVLGGGHRSCVYINLLQIKDYIEFVIDDDPHKQSLRMPGSRLPIRRSNALLESNIKLCLLGINPESENKVIARSQDFVNHGGCFASISPNSVLALKLDASIG
jgi:hypothetical protein